MHPCYFVFVQRPRSDATKDGGPEGEDVTVTGVHAEDFAGEEAEELAGRFNNSRLNKGSSLIDPWIGGRFAMQRNCLIR